MHHPLLTAVAALTIGFGQFLVPSVSAPLSQATVTAAPNNAAPAIYLKFWYSSSGSGAEERPIEFSSQNKDQIKISEHTGENYWDLALDAKRGGEERNLHIRSWHATPLSPGTYVADRINDPYVPGVEFEFRGEGFVTCKGEFGLTDGYLNVSKGDFLSNRIAVDLELSFTCWSRSLQKSARGVLKLGRPWLREPLKLDGTLNRQVEQGPERQSFIVAGTLRCSRDVPVSIRLDIRQAEGDLVRGGQASMDRECTSASLVDFKGAIRTDEPLKPGPAVVRLTLQARDDSAPVSAKWEGKETIVVTP